MEVLRTNLPDHCDQRVASEEASDGHGKGRLQSSVRDDMPWPRAVTKTWTLWFGRDTRTGCNCGAIKGFQRDGNSSLAGFSPLRGIELIVARPAARSPRAVAGHVVVAPKPSLLVGSRQHQDGGGGVVASLRGAR